MNPRKPAVLLFITALLLDGSALAVRGQSALGASTPSPAQPINFSTRMRVQTGDNVGIGGFIITGTVPKKILIRGIGPSLNGVGVTLPDPTLELRDSITTLATNDNWKIDDTSNKSQEADIRATRIPPTNDLESAILKTLDPGTYTAILVGKNDDIGVGLVEVYDLGEMVYSKLANISTRAYVGTGNNIVIAGFVLGNNNGNDRIAVRGLGPSLSSHGVANALEDPTLELRNSNGAILIANNNWQDDPTQAAELRAAKLDPSDPHESGMIATLPPANYTALLTGLNNSVGVGLVEVYDLGTPPTAAPVNATITRTQTGTSSTIEKQHVAFDSPRFSGTFRISVYRPSSINDANIGARAALQGQTAPISFTASAKEIVAAIEAIPNYYAYRQFGNLEFGPGPFSYFATQGAINREPIVTLDVASGTATAGFTIEFGSLVGNPPRYNTWVAGMPLVVVSFP